MRLPRSEGKGHSYDDHNLDGKQLVYPDLGGRLSFLPRFAIQTTGRNGESVGNRCVGLYRGAIGSRTAGSRVYRQNHGEGSLSRISRTMAAGRGRRGRRPQTRSTENSAEGYRYCILSHPFLALGTQRICRSRYPGGHQLQDGRRNEPDQTDHLSRRPGRHPIQTLAASAEPYSGRRRTEKRDKYPSRRCAPPS